MQLADFLRKSGQSVTEFAQAIGVTGASVYKYRDGTRRPRPAVLYRIVTATDGAVQANDFYAPPAVNQLTPGE